MSLRSACIILVVVVALVLAGFLLHAYGVEHAPWVAKGLEDFAAVASSAAGVAAVIGAMLLFM